MVAFVTFFFGGLKGQNAIVFSAVLVFIGSVLGGRVALLAAIITIAWCSFLVYLEINNLLPNYIDPGYSPVNSWSAMSVTFGILSVLLYNLLKSIATSEERYRILFENNKDAITTTEPDATPNYTSANKSALKLFKINSEEEFINYSPVDLSPEFQPDGITSEEKRKLIAKIASEKGSHSFEWVHKKSTGEEFICQISLTFVEIEGVKIYQSTIQDITEQKLIHQAIKESEERFKGLSEASFEAIIIHRNGTIINHNQTFGKMINHDNDILVEKKLIDYLPFDDISKKEFIKHLENRNTEPYLIDAYRSNGQKWIAEVRGSYITYLGQEARVEAIRDVTEIKKAELIISQNAEILKNQNRQLIDFCNIVSHNLRGPLVNLSMLIDIIQDSNNENEKAMFIEKLKPVITLLNNTFEELVESIQIKNDAEVASEFVSFEEIMKKCLQLFEGEIIMSKATISCNFQEAPNIFFPTKYLESIFQNLFSNALKYKSNERSPVIEIETKIVAQNVILSVKDNGLGINLKKHGHNLFKIKKTFHDHPNAKGFGLYMTKTQVEALGGKIWVESEEGIGSTFYVEIQNHHFETNAYHFID
ncbi:MAG: PAS domain-containing sensor histidine kinase [Bacteroidota bacterium]|nr:PAS domain-containing sensor histidine kinase [Bacteroidota bacterium]